MCKQCLKIWSIESTYICIYSIYMYIYVCVCVCVCVCMCVCVCVCVYTSNILKLLFIESINTSSALKLWFSEIIIAIKQCLKIMIYIERINSESYFLYRLIYCWMYVWKKLTYVYYSAYIFTLKAYYVFACISMHPYVCARLFVTVGMSIWAYVLVHTCVMKEFYPKCTYMCVVVSLCEWMWFFVCLSIHA